MDEPVVRSNVTANDKSCLATTNRAISIKQASVLLTNSPGCSSYVTWLGGAGGAFLVFMFHTMCCSSLHTADMDKNKKTLQALLPSFLHFYVSPNRPSFIAGCWSFDPLLLAEVIRILGKRAGVALRAGGVGELQAPERNDNAGSNTLSNQLEQNPTCRPESRLKSKETTRCYHASLLTCQFV